MAKLKTISQKLAVVIVSLFWAQSVAALPPWYVGVSGSVTKLSPNTENSAFRLEEDTSFGGGAFIGFDVTRLFNVELGYNYLGNAVLANQVGENDLAYSAISAGAMMYVYGDSRDIERRDGFAGYVRLGLNAMQNTTNIPLEKEDNVAIWAGAGVEWPFTRNISARGEIATFDGDAQAFSLALVYRPRNDQAQRATNRMPTAASQPAATQAPEPATVQRPSVNREEMKMPEIVSVPKTNMPQQPRIIGDSCMAAVANELSDNNGCALFRGPLVGVDFASGTANLQASSRQVLDKLVSNLQRYPNVRIEIAAHTESFSNARTAKSVASKRAFVVAKYLAQNGISVKRLSARAFGNAQPIASDQTVAGRRLNNRIEIKQIR